MSINILPHHQATIDKLTEHFRADPANHALLIGGSIAKGLARPASDVDVMLVVSDDEYARRGATFYMPELSTYEGGYVDGKYMNVRFLLEAAERGSEPTRWSFLNSIVVFSQIPDIHNLLNRIGQYPIQEQAAKIRSFYGQIYIMNYYAGEAEKLGDTYLMSHAAADMVLFGARLLLAHNRMLYPYHKWLMTEVRRAPDKPDDFIPLAETLLRQPSAANAKAVYECVANFRDWGIEVRDVVNAFAEDCERSWLRGRPAVGDW